MKFYGQAQEIAGKILERFEAGNVAAPLSLALVPKPQGDRPFDRWSISNRLGLILQGSTDARTYLQWQEAGRQVMKGQKMGYWILAPLTFWIDPEDHEKGQRLGGLKSVGLFDIGQTSGPELTQEGQEIIDSLPLLNVAEKWGINVYTDNTAARGAAGIYIKTEETTSIALGVKNLKTWLHELIHAADDRLGSLQEKGQNWRSEIVADLGAATLAHLIGEPEKADEGRVWEYVKYYAKEADREPIDCCMKVLTRLSECVALILEEAFPQGETPAAAQ